MIYAWTDGLMRTIVNSERHINGFAMHYYCGNAGDPVNFTEEEWYKQLSQAADMKK